MNKLITIILLLIFTISVFSGCLTNENSPLIPAASEVPNNSDVTVDMSDPSRVVLVVIDGTENIYLSEFISLWDSYLYQYGIDETILNDPAYTDDLSALQEQIMNSLVWEKVLHLQLTQLGYYNLTPAEIKEAEAAKEALIANYIATYDEELTAELGDDYTNAEYNLAVLQYRYRLLDSWNMTENELLDFHKGDIATRNAKAELISEEEPTHEQLRELYDAKVEADKQNLAENPTMFEIYKLNYGYAPYYTPEEYRNIKQILIKFSDETVEAIKELRESEDDDGADALIKEALLTIKEEAEEALAKLQSEELTFEEAIVKYNDDPGMEAYPEGYPVNLESIAYMQNFIDGAFTLIKIGDISELIVTDYGYHILKYADDLTPGPIDYELVVDKLSSEIIPTLMDNAWAKLVSSWFSDYEIVINDVLTQ